MRQYGPQADEGRSILRTDLVWAHEQFWGDEKSRAAAYEASFKAMGNMNKFFDGLQPKTPGADAIARHAARATTPSSARSGSSCRCRPETPVAWPLIYAVTVWSCLMFASMGLLSRLSPMSCDARFRQRLGRACDLSDPRVQQALYQRLIRVSPSRWNRRSSTSTSRPPRGERRFSVSREERHAALPDSERRRDSLGLAELPDWSLRAPNIEAKFELKTFRDAIAFIVEIAIEAEVMNHHPEFHNSYNVVSFSFCTHDAGMKITDLDIETAKRISALARRFQSMA